MHYIINPWVFYLLHVVNAIQGICILFIIAFGLLFSVYLISFDDIPDERYPSPIAILKKFKVPIILSVTFLVFVPSKDTLYKMLIASQVTTENIDTAKETIQDVADYIVDAVKEIKEKEDD